MIRIQYKSISVHLRNELKIPGDVTLNIFKLNSRATLVNNNFLFSHYTSTLISLWLFYDILPAKVIKFT